jgi:acyl transferase domain-containing protein/acyl carrier protein
MIPSPDGHCRAFDADAHGTVLSQGVGVVVLKRLSEALSDGDTIHAVIKGVAINNDGALKAGYTAPSVDGQAQVIAMAYGLSGVTADTISYIETHGTGTPLGDPIEIAALTQAFRASTEKKGFCAIGSVKTNIGHADAAAGIAGLIKTILMLKHKQIPPSLHFKRSNPSIDFGNSPFYVATQLSEWPDNGSPRRAGVSSFGIGGTNVHAVLEEAPAAQPSGKSRPWQLLLISAHTSNALEKAATNLVEHMKNSPQQNLSDVVYTLHMGRKAFNYRRMVVCKDRDDAIRSLDPPNSGLAQNSYQEPVNRDVVFMFSGQGSQYVNMGLELFRTESVFREHIDHCSEILRSHLSLDLRDILYPEKGNIEELAQQLKQTSITQPALFTIEYALAKLWMAWGVHPAAMVGHSSGEYVAACLSGVFSVEDALFLVVTRGRLMQELPAGTMLAVQLSEKDIERFLNRRLSLAGVNAPSYCVVSGEQEAVRELEGGLEKNNVAFTRLHTSHAFHSTMMEPILGPFMEQAKKIVFHPPQIPFLSNLTGTWITSEEAMSSRYWARHLRHTVLFSSCVQELMEDSNRIFLEVGPGQTLSTFVRQHSDGSKGRVVLSSLRHPKEEKSDVAFILNTLGRLWLAGVLVDWAGFYKNEERHRIPLPTYPFERQRYWPEKVRSAQPATIALRGRDKRLEMKEWFYVPSWKRSLLPKQLNGRGLRDRKLCWLVFVDGCGLGFGLIEQLEQQNQEVIVVQIGEKFAMLSKGTYTVNPEAEDDYDALIREMRNLGKNPQKIIHLWSVTQNQRLPSEIQFFNRIQELGFYSLVFLTQALAKQHMMQLIELEVITDHIHEINDEWENFYPEKTPVLAACKVIPQEYANITCRNIDFLFKEPTVKQIEQLLDEIASPLIDSIVVYRGKHRWVQIFEPVKFNGTAGIESRLRKEGVYLITGGLGGVGLTLAEYLAEEARAKLILVGRSGLPASEQWRQWPATHPEKGAVSHKIQRILALEEQGAEVLTMSADVGDENQMREVIVQGERRFGQINGVIHAAGVFIDTPIQGLNRDICEQQFQSKVKGLFVLEKVLEGKNIDFCAVSSSLASVLGGLGFVGYAAANIFVDSFVHWHNYHHSVQWISINWDAWRFEDEIGKSARRGTDLGGLSIEPKEGAEAFQHILSLDLGAQILVSTCDLQARIDNWIKLESLREPRKEKEIEGSALHARPTLSSEYVAPGNPMEQTIADIWQELLKIEKVGIHDNFFELGGHSLLALQILARLRNRFPIQISAASLFERPTVHLLSTLIMKEQKGELSFKESSIRGQKRKERRLQRMMQGKEQE